MKVYAAVLAAGSGTRFGRDKLGIPVRGRPLWKWSFDTLAGHPRIEGVGIVCRPGQESEFRSAAPEAIFVVPGGETRSDSARAAILAMPADGEIALLHDAARPLLDAETISRVVEAAQADGAAAPGLPATDTIKIPANFGGWATVDRTTIRLMQTPQGARIDWLREAFDAPGAEGATDELALLEAGGKPATIVEGSSRNFKVTLPDDLARLSGLLGAPEVRTGIGYDIHAFSNDPARELWLGGVRFEEGPGLEGHSDADVLLHAIVDALLGAAGQGDIGTHFPNDDPRWKGESSSSFLRFASSHIAKLGWRIRNVDATLIAETPKVMGRAAEIRGAIASAAGVEPERISLKATTNERLGSIGRGEGIAAFAVATIAQFP